MGNLKPMRLAKKVRETARLNSWAMYKRMGKNSVQSYLSLERSAKRISLKDYFSLLDVWVEEGCGTAEEFHSLARQYSEKP